MDTAHVKTIVKKLTEKLKEAGSYDDFVDRFTKCTKNIDRIKIVYPVLNTSSIIEVKKNFKQKDKRQAEIRRSEGNNLFKAGKYVLATHAYTQSILLAPDDSENLALAYNNRSTANFYLKNYRMCLQDIDMAFLHLYPKKSEYKLYQRRGRCMYYMTFKEEAIKAFQQTIDALTYAEIIADEKKVMVSDMEKVIQQCAIIQDLVGNSFLYPNKFHSKIPKLSGVSNDEIPCLSNCVEVRLDSFGGRGLFAKRDIEIGEVLIVEKPFSSALLKEFNLSHCMYCCNRVVLPLPCQQCSGVVFCSLSCRDAAWKSFHWAECQIMESLQDTRGDLSFLATRMIVTAGVGKLNELMEVCESDKEVLRDSGFSKDGIFQSEDYVSAHSLVNHASKRTFDDLLIRTVAAVYVLMHLEYTGFVSEDLLNKRSTKEHTCEQLLNESSGSIDTGHNVISDNNDLQTRKMNVGGHILRNIMMLPCNAHEVSEFSLNTEAPAMSITTELAGAIYPVLSLINHSCDPSVVRHSFGNICVARAIRSIKAGHELKDNYGALYPTMELNQRQQAMQSQYFFCCRCEACVSDWPLYFEIPCAKPVMRCIQCDGCVPIPQDNKTENACCQLCGRRQEIESTILGIVEMEDNYREALTSVIDGDTSEDKINTLLSYLRFVDCKVHRPWRDINDAQEAFKQCLNVQANCFPQG